MFARIEEPRGYRSAFTIIELLVVIGVIVILLSILVPAVQSIREKVAITKTQMMIGGIGMALDQYKTAFSVYPPDKTPLLDKSSEALVWALSGASLVYVPGTSSATYPWRNTAYQDTSSDGSGRRSSNVFYEFKSFTLADIDGDLAPELIDHWGKKLVYNSGKSVTDATNDPNYNQYDAPRHGIKRFDLFSAGPNKVFGTTDDITSWGSSTAVYNEYTSSEYSTFNSQ